MAAICSCHMLWRTEVIWLATIQPKWAATIGQPHPNSRTVASHGMSPTGVMAWMDQH